MPDIYVIDRRKDEGEQIRSICFNYLMFRNIEAESRLVDSVSGIGKETCLCMVECSEGLVPIVFEIRSLNSMNYVVLIIKSFSELASGVRPGICPSGYVLLPPEKDKIYELLDAVFEDYLHCTENEECGLFRFKIKSKEFSVPYDRIILFESSNKKIMLRTENQEFEFYDTLDNVLKSVPQDFIQIHKSYVVNSKHIISVDYGGQTVCMDDGSEAYLSRTYKSSLRELMASRGAEK